MQTLQITCLRDIGLQLCTYCASPFYHVKLLLIIAIGLEILICINMYQLSSSRDSETRMTSLGTHGICPTTDGEMLVFSSAEYIICSGGHVSMEMAVVRRNIGFDIPPPPPHF